MERSTSSVIDDLQSLRRYDTEVQRLEEQIEQYYAMAQSLTQTMSDMPRGSTNIGKMAVADAVIKILDAKARLAEYLGEMAEKREDMRECISRLPEQQKTILELRYIDGMGWRKLSRTMNYAERHCRRICSAGIKRLERMREDDVRELHT